MKWLNILILLSIIIISGCNSQVGHRGVSSSVEASIENELFVADYEVVRNPYVINDSLSLDIKRAWLEKQWKYGENSSIIIIKNKYQLIVETNEGLTEEYSFDWTIGIDAKKYFRSASDNDLICDFDDLPEEKIKIIVQKGRKLKGTIDSKDIIGEIEFVRTSEIINK